MPPARPPTAPARPPDRKRFRENRNRYFEISHRENLKQQIANAVAIFRYIFRDTVLTSGTLRRVQVPPALRGTSGTLTDWNGVRARTGR